jgi:hypothetical protein
VRARDSQNQARGDADDYDTGSLFWDDASVDAKHGCARVSSLARGDWVERPLEFDDQPPYPSTQQSDPAAGRDDSGSEKGYFEYGSAHALLDPTSGVCLTSKRALEGASLCVPIEKTAGHFPPPKMPCGLRVKIECV